MSFRTLIRDLAAIDRMLFVVGGGACVSEMYGDGKTEPEFHDRWGMIESGPWHLHLDMSSIKQAQFVEAEDHGAPMLYYVRFPMRRTRPSSERIFRIHTWMIPTRGQSFSLRSWRRSRRCGTDL